MDFKLLFILPDRTNQNVLALKTEAACQFPVYESRIEDKTRGAVPQLEDIPQPYNDYFKTLTGISVFRKYVVNSEHYIVFVCEQIEEANGVPANGYSWISYDVFLGKQQDSEIIKITNSVRSGYLESTSFAPCIAWLQKICADKNIRITGDIAQLKYGALIALAVFRVPTDIGDLYLKVVGDTAVNEVIFTHKLVESGLPNLPAWIDHNLELNAFLSRDMGGEDLSSHSKIKPEDALNLVTALARVQKESIPYVNSAGFYGYDYRIGAIIDDLKTFPEDAYETLSQTPYKIKRGKKKKIARNIEHVIATLKSIDAAHIPDTIYNSDMALYNIRFADGRFIFYDWSWGGVSHPFFNMARLLDAINSRLPEDISEEAILDAYLREWSDYGSHEELRRIFKAVHRLKIFQITYFLKYIRTRYEHRNAGRMEVLSVKSRGLDKRYENFAEYLNRFIDEDYS